MTFIQDTSELMNFFDLLVQEDQDRGIQMQEGEKSPKAEAGKKKSSEILNKQKKQIANATEESAKYLTHEK